MTLIVVTADDVGTGVRRTLAGGDQLIVEAGVTVARTNATAGPDATIAAADSASIDIFGLVASAGTTFDLGNDTLNDSFTLRINPGGFVRTYIAAAPIPSTAVAFDIVAASAVIFNDGRIVSDGVGVAVGATGTFRLENTGTFFAPFNAIARAGDSLVGLFITNSGIMEGRIGLDGIGGAVDRIVNTGLLAGDVFLTGGDDLFDSSAGTFVSVSRTSIPIVSGGDGKDQLLTGAGTQLLDGGAGDDILSGGAGNDSYTVTTGDRIVEAVNGGTDGVFATQNFTLPANVENLATSNAVGLVGIGNALNNVMTADITSVTLFGLGGNDRLLGGTAGCVLDGGIGNDRLDGLGGSDTLRGGLGNDALIGGGASDGFVFNTALNAATNRDIVTDFVHLQDKLVLENAIFTKLTAVGDLNPAFFRAGAAALDANDFIVYNRATGLLSFDVNGNVAGGSIAFASLSNRPLLTAADFQVI